MVPFYTIASLLRDGRPINDRERGREDRGH